MFTGIVEAMGKVSSLDRHEGGARLCLPLPWDEAPSLGDSVAVNGCCLTVAAWDNGIASFDLLDETLDKTNLGSLKVDSAVNMERPLLLGSRLHGHFVLGHVDGTGEVLALEAVGDDHRFEVSIPEGFRKLVAYKGSVAIDGMSLTVAEVGDASMTCWITPHTYKVTRLCGLKAGAVVNLEFDVIARYVLGAAEVEEKAG